MRRKLALLLAVVMILSLVPMMSFAASGSISATTPVVTKDKTSTQELGTIRVEIPAGARTGLRNLRVSLPSGVTPTVYSTAANNTSVTGFGAVVPNNFNGETNGLQAANVTVKKVSARVFDIEFNDNVAYTNDALVIIQLEDITVDASAGEIEITLDASPNSGIPTGKVVVGRVATGRSVSLSTAGRSTTLDSFDFHLDVVEDTPGSLDGRSVTLRLPAGYEWDGSNNGSLTVEGKFGHTFTATGSVDDEYLEITFAGGATEVSSFRVKNLEFFVADESKVRDGEIVARVTTSSGLSRSTNNLTVGTRADFGVTIEMDEVEEVQSGKIEQEIGDIIIKESVAESLIEKRTISLRLPSEARWVDGTANIDTEEGTVITANVTSSGRILALTVDTTVTDADTITIEDVEIIVEAGFEGEIVAEIMGSQGIRGELVIAEAVRPVEVETTSAAPTVVIGRAAQAAANFKITEIDGGALASTYDDEGDSLTAYIDLVLPVDVEWAKTPNVKALEDDVNLGTPRRLNNNRIVRIPVDAESFDADTIEVTDVEITVYRTVPEGRVELEVRGTAVVDAETVDVWGESDKVASVVIATVGTPAEAGREEVSLTIGVVPEGGDVAPYLANNRTYAPVSVVAQALGVAKSNIIWNEANRTVTVLGDKTVQMTIGSTELLVNGTPVVMDAAPEITNSRTFLPIAWLAKALDVNYAWDAVTQTVTFY